MTESPPLPAATPGDRRSLLLSTLRHPSLRLMGIGVLILILLIPLYMIENTISERSYYQQRVVSDIGQSWGAPQALAGPIFEVLVTYKPAPLLPEAETDKEAQTRQERMQAARDAWPRRAYVLPESLDIKATLSPELRHRGIFEAVVYRLTLDAEGTVALPALGDLFLHTEEVASVEVRALVALPDMRSIRTDAALAWNDSAIPLVPDVNTTNITQTALVAPLAVRLPSGNEAARSDRFAFSLEVKGSASLEVVPLGKTTKVHVKAPWQDPSFYGNYLPEDYSIEPGKGFAADWQVSYYGRPYPQLWTTDYLATHGHNLSSLTQQSAFGVKLLVSAGAYQQSERAIKYGILFIALTFAVLFLIERSGQIRVTMPQYLLLGLSLCLFFLMLTATAEHLPFSLSYAVSATLIIGQATLFSMGVTRSLRKGGIIGGVLIALYVYLYLLLQLEDWALLVGTIGLFLALSLLMYFMRRPEEDIRPGG